MVASFKLILCGLIFVDCFYNFALDTNCVDFPLDFFVLRDPRTAQTTCLDAFLSNSDSHHRRGRVHMTMNRLQCDIQLQGCQLGHMLPEHPKTMWPVAEDIVRSPDVSAWKSALYDGLRSADGFHVPSVDGTMKTAMGVRRRDVGTPLTLGGSQHDHVDHNTWVLTTRTLQGAVLDFAVVPSDSKSHVVVSTWRTRFSPTVEWVCIASSWTTHRRRCTPPCRVRFHFGASR